MSLDTALDSVDVGANTTVFYRQTETGVEGFVIDNLRLVDSLKQRVLDERGLSEIADLLPRSTLEPSSLERPSDVVDAYQHQFSEPFSSVTAWLRLSPLEVPFTEQLLLPLAFALGVFIVLGLFLLFRVVDTQLEFAERQNNFISAVTHELKTPLTAIRMHGEMLQDGLVESPEKAQEYFRTITTQAERLSRLIGNVLWISNVERNPGAAPQLGDLRASILQTATALGPHVDKSGFTLTLDLPDEMPSVVRDPDSVEQILFNLVENSIKYAKDAKDRRITLGAEVSSMSVKLTVRDRGPGVPEAKLGKIFEPFFRAEDEMTRRSAGTGLGLSLVDHLARRMGAKVSAENADPGMRVTVDFSLPGSGKRK